MKISRINQVIALTLFSFISVFYAILNVKFPMSLHIFLLFLMVLLSLMSGSFQGKIRIVKKIPKWFYPWMVFLVFVIFGIPNSNLGSIRIISCILFAIFLRHDYKWIPISYKLIGFFLGLNVLFTFYFLIFPQTYHVMIELYGYVPTGTSNGTAGYRAGIANHYSQNGIYISILFMLLTVIIYSSRKNIRRSYRNLLIIFLTLTFSALILSAKRGVLIWSVGAIFFTYILTSNKKTRKTIKALIVLFALVGILQVLSESIPSIAYIFSRFQLMGEDSESRARLAMWDLGIKKFLENPIFGNGFWSYRSAYSNSLASIWSRNTERFKRLDAHNVYIQVLCETGVVGFSIYIFSLISVLKRTIKLINDELVANNLIFRTGISVSLCIQIFYMLYSFSGNCLYDIVFCFYAFSIAILLSIEYNIGSKILAKGPAQ